MLSIWSFSLFFFVLCSVVVPYFVHLLSTHTSRLAGWVKFGGSI